MENSRIGISGACFYPTPADEALKRCIDLGFKNVELFINTFSELKEDFLKSLKSFADGRNVKITSIHPFTSGFEYMLFFSAHKGRAMESAELYRHYFRAARILGADFVVFHGDALKAPFFGMERYCEVYSHLSKIASEYDVTLAHECVSTARGGNPEFIKELRSAMGMGNIKFVFDVKQVVRGGYAPFDMIDAMGSDIAHVHINDYADGKCWLPYSGALDMDKIISKVEETGYKGKYIIEVYRENFSLDCEITKAAKIICEKNYG